MGFYAIFPYFAGTFALLLLASTPLLRAADAPPTIVPARVQTIDGLRGFLALGVFFHHAAVYHQYLLTGKWDLPPSRFYTNLGQVGVAMFFMITGYLFWTQMLKAEGRPNFLKLYTGRLFRIVPLYLLLAMVVLTGAGILTGWRLQEPPLNLTKDVVKWLAGGVVVGGPVNRLPGTSLISAGVTWTLSYEWLFYISLLVTSFFARTFILGSLMPILGGLAMALLLAFHSDLSIACALLFFVGMTSGSVKRTGMGKSFTPPQWALSVGVVACVAIVLFGFNGVYSAVPILILGVGFGLIVSGATVFGLLLTRPAKRLGDISYGIYLLQGPILFLIFAMPAARSFASASVPGHWTIVMIAGGTLVMLATATHALIERPGVKAGQFVWTRISSMRREETAPASSA